MNKLVLVSFLVIFIGGCHGFPNGVEVRDQHFQNEIESRIHVDNDQHLEKGKAEIERHSQGNSVMKILRMLVKELQSVRKNQDNMTSAISNQDSKLDAIRDNQDNMTSAISNQDSKLDAMSSDISNMDSKQDSMSSDMSNIDSKVDSLNSAFSVHDSKLDSMSSAISNLSAKLDSVIDTSTMQPSTIPVTTTTNSPTITTTTPADTSTMQPSTIPVTTTTNSPTITTTTPAACPAGGFIISGTCFKVFTDKYRTWAAGRSKCQQEGLEIAQPADGAAIQLRKHIIDNYAERGYWVGGQGDGSYIRWVRGGAAIPSSNTLWYPSYPSSVTSRYCMLVEAYQSVWQREPNKPYLSLYCSRTDFYTVCEEV